MSTDGKGVSVDLTIKGLWEDGKDLTLRIRLESLRPALASVGLTGGDKNEHRSSRLAADAPTTQLLDAVEVRSEGLGRVLQIALTESSSSTSSARAAAAPVVGAPAATFHGRALQMAAAPLDQNGTAWLPGSPAAAAAAAISPAAVPPPSPPPTCSRQDKPTPSNWEDEKEDIHGRNANKGSAAAAASSFSFVMRESLCSSLSDDDWLAATRGGRLALGKWSAHDVAHWVASFEPLRKYAKACLDKRVDGASLLRRFGSGASGGGNSSGGANGIVGASIGGGAILGGGGLLASSPAANQPFEFEAAAALLATACGIALKAHRRLLAREVAVLLSTVPHFTIAPNTTAKTSTVSTAADAAAAAADASAELLLQPATPLAPSPRSIFSPKTTGPPRQHRPQNLPGFFGGGSCGGGYNSITAMAAAATTSPRLPPRPMSTSPPSHASSSSPSTSPSSSLPSPRLANYWRRSSGEDDGKDKEGEGHIRESAGSCGGGGGGGGASSGGSVDARKTTANVAAKKRRPSRRIVVLMATDDGTGCNSSRGSGGSGGDGGGGDRVLTPKEAYNAAKVTLQLQQQELQQQHRQQQQQETGHNTIADDDDAKRNTPHFRPNPASFSAVPKEKKAPPLALLSPRPSQPSTPTDATGSLPQQLKYRPQQQCRPARLRPLRQPPLLKSLATVTATAPASHEVCDDGNDGYVNDADDGGDKYAVNGGDSGVYGGGTASFSSSSGSGGMVSPTQRLKERRRHSTGDSGTCAHRPRDRKHREEKLQKDGQHQQQQQKQQQQKQQKQEWGQEQSTGAGLRDPEGQGLPLGLGKKNQLQLQLQSKHSLRSQHRPGIKISSAAAAAAAAKTKKTNATAAGGGMLLRRGYSAPDPATPSLAPISEGCQGGVGSGSRYPRYRHQKEVVPTSHDAVDSDHNDDDDDGGEDKHTQQKRRRRRRRRRRRHSRKQLHESPQKQQQKQQQQQNQGSPRRPIFPSPLLTSPVPAAVAVAVAAVGHTRKHNHSHSDGNGDDGGGSDSSRSSDSSTGGEDEEGSYGDELLSSVTSEEEEKEERREALELRRQRGGEGGGGVESSGGADNNYGSGGGGGGGGCLLELAALRPRPITSARRNASAPAPATLPLLLDLDAVNAEHDLGLEESYEYNGVDLTTADGFKLTTQGLTAAPPQPQFNKSSQLQPRPQLSQRSQSQPQPQTQAQASSKAASASRSSHRDVNEYRHNDEEKVANNLTPLRRVGVLHGDGDDDDDQETVEFADDDHRTRDHSHRREGQQPLQQLEEGARRVSNKGGFLSSSLGSPPPPLSLPTTGGNEKNTSNASDNSAASSHAMIPESMVAAATTSTAAAAAATATAVTAQNLAAAVARKERGRWGNMKDGLVVLEEGGLLGKGAAGTVRKALFVPELLLVAVKSVPVFEDSRRRQLLRELRALHAVGNALLPDGVCSPPTHSSPPASPSSPSASTSTSWSSSSTPPSSSSSSSSLSRGGNLALSVENNNKGGEGDHEDGNNAAVSNDGEDSGVSDDEEDEDGESLLQTPPRWKRRGRPSPVKAVTRLQPPSQLSIGELTSSSSPPARQRQPILPLDIADGEDDGYRHKNRDEHKSREVSPSDRKQTHQKKGETQTSGKRPADLSTAPPLSPSSPSSPPSSPVAELSSSPFVVNLFDAFTDPNKGSVCLVLEFMNAGSLQGLISAKAAMPLEVCIPESMVAMVADSVLQGLQAIHARKQLHRDIKPSNILLDCANNVKIADFGIARELGTVSLANSFTGTLTFMSPERIAGEDYEYSSDVWSLGLCLIALAQGRVPLPTHLGYWAVVRAIQDDNPPALEYTFEEQAAQQEQERAAAAAAEGGGGEAKKGEGREREGEVGSSASGDSSGNDDDEGDAPPQLPLHPCPGRPGPGHPPWSQELRDFLAKCLTKDPRLRGLPKTLLHHPFLQEHRRKAAELPGSPPVKPTAGLYSHVRQLAKVAADFYLGAAKGKGDREAGGGGGGGVLPPLDFSKLSSLAAQLNVAAEVVKGVFEDEWAARTEEEEGNAGE